MSIVLQLLTVPLFIVGAFIGVRLANWWDEHSLDKEFKLHEKMKCVTTGGTTCEMWHNPQPGFEFSYKCDLCGRVYQEADPESIWLQPYGRFYPMTIRK